jgi:glycosyltransferase 2 family protein
LILILILISFKTMKKIPTFLGKLVAFLKNKLNLSFLDSIQNGLDKLSTTFLTLKFETRHLTAIFFLVLHWFAGGMEVFAIFYLLGESIWVVNAFFIDFGVMIFKSLGQFIPGQAGIEELGNSYMLKVVGLKSSAFWLSFTILRRLRMMFFVVQSLLYMAYLKWSNHTKPIVS